MSSIGAYATARRGGVSMAEIDAVRGKLGSRATVAQIAKMIGRCEADVRAVLSPPPQAPVASSDGFRWTEHRVRLAGLMRDAGATSDEIGQAVGCSGASVRVFFQRASNKEAATQPASELTIREQREKDRRDLFTRLWMQGVTADEITQRMGWKTVKYVNQWRAKLDLPTRRRVPGSLAYTVPGKAAA